MKFPAALSLALVLSCAQATDLPSAPATVQGVVLEVQDVDAYTYLRLQTAQGDTWAAVNKTPVKKGDKLTLSNVTVMTNFESRTLHKTFPSILFGTLGDAGAPAMAATPVATPTARELEAIHVAKASGANARTVAELWAERAALKDKPVLLHAQVVKVNANIMGRNWLHLRDGSGAAGSNDMLVTTTELAQVGDVISVRGVVRTDQDFGSGYAYKVLIEQATLQK